MDDAMLTGIVLPIASAIAACGAAYFALQPAKIQLQEHAASIVDVPALYILDNRIAISDLSQPNRRACALSADPIGSPPMRSLVLGCVQMAG